MKTHNRAMEESAIKLTDVRVTADGLRSLLREPSDAQHEDHVILDSVSLDLKQGETLSILGESGGGKSTLMRTINRLVNTEQGSVHVLGRAVEDWDVAELRRTATFVPQRSFLFGGSVRDELTRPQIWNKRPTIKLSFGRILEAVELSGKLDQDASELSEGQRQRLCLARAMLLQPKILLLDEPTGALDVRTSRQVLANLKQWAEQHEVTLLVVTHRPEDLSTLGGDALILLNGKVAGRYTAQEVADGKVDALAGAFLGSSS